jgi:hypothetical protein
MSPSEIKASYRRMMDAVGEPIAIRRYTGTGANRPFFDAPVMARVVEFKPSDLVGDIIQGDRSLIVIAQDLIDAQVPLNLRKGDKAMVRGKELNIEAVDDNTRRVQGELIAYEIRVRG